MRPCRRCRASTAERTYTTAARRVKFQQSRTKEISTHTADGDALVTVLDGTGRFTIDGEAHLVSAGESIVMPAHVPHAVYGQTRFKMLLTVIV